MSEKVRPHRLVLASVVSIAVLLQPFRASAGSLLNHPFKYGMAVFGAVAAIQALNHIHPPKAEGGTGNRAGSGDPCGDLIRKMQGHIGGMKQKYQNLLDDKMDLYNTSHDATPGGGISWLGHITIYEGYKTGLIKMIIEAKLKGCEVPEDAIEWATRPTPRKPA